MLDKIRKAEPNAELDEALSQLTPDELKMIAGGDGENQGPPYVCQYCGESFQTITTIACHISAKHKKH